MTTLEDSYATVPPTTRVNTALSYLWTCADLTRVKMMEGASSSLMTTTVFVRKALWWVCTWIKLFMSIKVVAFLHAG